MSAETNDELRRLGVPPDHPRVVALLPLVEVAWADGEVQPAERDAIVDIARTKFKLDPDGELLLESWLTFAPSEAYLARGRKALMALVRERRVGLEVADEEVASGVLQDAEAVAKAAGGWFGFRAVDTREQSALEGLAAAFAQIHQQHSHDAAKTIHTWDGDDDEDRTDPGAIGTSPGASSGVVADDVPTVDGPSVLIVGTTTPIPIGERITLGRHGDNTISLPADPRVSRYHAELVIEDGGRVVVRDLGSANGTYVSEERIVGRRLFGGETVRVGSSQVLVLGVSPV